jgi:hypothetical protein
MPVELQSVLAVFSKQFDKKKGKGTDKTTVTANITLLIPKDLVDYFGMPVPADSKDNKNAITPAKVKAHTRKIFSDVSGAATTIEVPEFSRAANTNARGRGIVLPLTGSATKKSCIICIPRYLNVLETTQLFSTLLKKNAPKRWKRYGGKSYVFVPNLPTAIPAGWTSGCWAVNAPVTPQNADDVSGVGGNTIIVSRRIAFKPGTEPAPNP